MSVSNTDYVMIMRDNKLYKEEVTSVAEYMSKDNISTDAGQSAVRGTDGGIYVASINEPDDISQAIASLDAAIT